MGWTNLEMTMNNIGNFSTEMPERGDTDKCEGEQKFGVETTC